MHVWLITLPQTISLCHQLFHYVMSLTGLKITLILCLLLSSLHSRTPCEHSSKLNTWAVDNLAPLDMLFLSIIALIQYNKPNRSKNHTSTFVYYLPFCKNRVLFYLEKKNGVTKTRAAGPLSPALLLLYFKCQISTEIER